MIFELLISLVMGFLDCIFFLLPDFSFAGLDSAITYFFNILSGVCYFLPMDTVGAIASIIYALFIFRLTISAIMSLWRLLPIL